MGPFHFFSVVSPLSNVVIPDGEIPRLGNQFTVSQTSKIQKEENISCDEDHVVFNKTVDNINLNLHCN
jgi:hypothetical protein